jgi:TonB-dependent receptor
MNRTQVCAALFVTTSLLALASRAFAADAEAGSRTVDQLIVTAPRQESTARAVELAAPNIVNVQSAETIAKYPDVNAAEALGRMPGVSLSIDTGEGRFVTIRGIDSNLDGATFGGVVLLNSFPRGTYFSGTGRAVEFDTIPIGAVDRIEVTKTILPDRDAEGVGGSIDLIPRSARGVTKPFVDIDVGGGYENLRKSWAPWQDQVVVGARFGWNDGLVLPGSQKDQPRAGFISNPTPFSFVISQYQHNDRRAIDDFEEAYGVDNGGPADPKVFDSAEFRRYNYFRRRFAYTGEFDFDPNEDHHYYARASLAGYTEFVNRQRLVYGNMEFDASGNPLVDGGPACAAGDPGPCSYVDAAHAGGFLAPDTQTQATLRDQKETHRNYLFAVGGDDKFAGGYQLDYQVAYTKATYAKPFDLNWTFNNPNAFNVAYNNTANSNFPMFNVLGGGNVLDPTQYALSSLSNSQEHDEDHEWSGAANLTVPVRFASDSDFLKFGVKARYREKTVTTTNQSYSIDATKTLADFAGGGPFTYYDGLYPIGFAPSGDALKKFVETTPGVLVGGEQTSRDLSGDYDDNENVLAGYGEANLTFGALSVLAGVRVENTRATYRGYIQGNDANGNPLPPTLSVQKETYTNAFPAVQFRYQFTPDLIGRFVYSTAIGRPGFTQVAPTTFVDVGGGSASTGNPNLKPTYANSLDLSLQYSLPANGVVSAGLFDKEMSNYIVARTTHVGSFEGINQLWTLATYQNVPAHARGAEAEYVQKFLGLPGLLKNLGVDSNITYVDSEVDLFGGGKSLLPGTSRWTGNAAVFYEDDRFQLRVSAEYVGKNIFSIGGSQDTTTYEDKRLQWDFTSSYIVNPMLTLYFNVKNLNNEPLRFYEGSPDRPLQREFYLQTFEFGARAHF